MVDAAADAAAAVEIEAASGIDGSRTDRQRTAVVGKGDTDGRVARAAALAKSATVGDNATTTIDAGIRCKKIVATIIEYTAAVNGQVGGVVASFMAYRALINKCAREYRFGYTVFGGMEDTVGHRVGDYGLARAGHAAARPIEVVDCSEDSRAAQSSASLRVASHIAITDNA